MYKLYFIVALLMVVVACSTSTINFDNDITSNIKHTIVIRFSHGEVIVLGDTTSEVNICTDELCNVNIKSTAQGVNYIIEGLTYQGSLSFDSKLPLCITLNNANIACSHQSPICITSEAQAYLMLADNTHNRIADNTLLGCKGKNKLCGGVCSNGILTIAGTGKLNVSSINNSAIRTMSDLNIVSNPMIDAMSEQYHAIAVRHNTTINGGKITGTAIADGYHALKVGDCITITNGSLNLNTHGNAKAKKKDRYKTSACMSADSTITINYGNICLIANGDGGKGIKTDGDIVINGGHITIQTNGTSEYGSAKGIKANKSITISDGQLQVVSHTSEGIESKNEITISGGEIKVEASDDAINATQHILIDGGYIWARSANNDAIDSNGNLCIENGHITAIGGHIPECGIDANEEEGYAVYISGGTIIAVGGWNSTPICINEKQTVVTDNGRFANATLSDAKGRVLMSFDANVAQSFRVKETPPPFNPDTLLMPPPFPFFTDANVPTPPSDIPIMDMYNYIFSSPALNTDTQYKIKVSK